MYSKNDYRYYLERQLGSDYLAHERSHKYIKKIGDRYFYTQQELAAFFGRDKKRSPGVEEMYKDRARLAITGGIEDTRITPKIAAKEKYYKGLATAGQDRERGRKRTQQEVERQRKTPVNDAQKRGQKQTSRVKSQQTIKADQDRGRKKTRQSKGSSEYNAEKAYNSKTNSFPKSTNTTPKKKKSLKSKVQGIRQKYGLYREKPKGKKLSGGGNIYVSHD